MEAPREQAPVNSDAATSPRRGHYRWLTFWSITLSLALILGVAAFLGSMSWASHARAAPGAPGVGTRLMPTVSPGTPGPCGGDVTVTRVTKRVITVTRSDGTTENVYVNSRTHYTNQGHTVSLSAIKVGSRLYIVGTCNNQGRTINATSIEIV